MHGAFTKFTHKEYGHQIKESIHKTAPSKFGNPIFPWAVLHYFFAYFSESCPFGQHRNITVHFSIYLNAFNHFFSIGLKSAVKVMQFYFTHASCCCIKKLTRNIFREGVIIPFLFPSAYQVKSIFYDHLSQFRYLIRTVLHICIHGNDYFALCGFKSFIQRCTFSIVALKFYSFDMFIFKS